MNVMREMMTSLAAKLGKEKVCPRCEELVKPEVDGLEIRCPKCDYKGRWEEWSAVVVREREGTPPPSSAIQYEEGGEEIVWGVAPAKRSSLLIMGGFFIVFALLGAFHIMFQEESELGSEVWVRLGLVLFFGAGCWMLHVGIKSAFTKHVLVLRGGMLICVSTLMGNVKKCRMRCEEITDISLEQQYKQNDHPVYAVKITSSERQLRLGQGLSETAQRWLVASLSSQVKRALPEDRPKAEQVLIVPPTNAKGYILISLACIGVAVASYCITQGELVGVLLFGGLFGGLGLYVLLNTLSRMGLKTLVKMEPEKIEVYKYRVGAPRLKRSISRKEITSIEMIDTGRDGQYYDLKVQMQNHYSYRIAYLRPRSDLTQAYQLLTQWYQDSEGGEN